MYFLNSSSKPVHADLKSVRYLLLLCVCFCNSNNNSVTIYHFGVVIGIRLVGRKETSHVKCAVDLLALALITGTVWIVLMFI